MLLLFSTATRSNDCLQLHQLAAKKTCSTDFLQLHFMQEKQLVRTAARCNSSTLQYFPAVTTTAVACGILVVHCKSGRPCLVNSTCTNVYHACSASAVQGTACRKMSAWVQMLSRSLSRQTMFDQFHVYQREPCSCNINHARDLLHQHVIK